MDILSVVDLIILLLFFLFLIVIGVYAGRGKKDSLDYLISKRNLNLTLFVLTTVSTWYGGILGVGEFSFNFGIFSWVTQGIPYYIFAIIFALLLAEKIRESEVVTIPDKLESVFDKKVVIIASILIFLLVNPAPYFLMAANLIELITGFNFTVSLIISMFLGSIYLIKGGFRANVLTDSFQFVIMFLGFTVIVFYAYLNFGGYEFISENVPENHFDITGGQPITVLIVWFFIALWTFADPGFHQRCNAARTPRIAKFGILISVIFWVLFDFLTTTTGFYSKAILKELDNPLLSFPLLANKILPSGIKGIFYAGLFATILSTANSFLFLSATTIGNDLLGKISQKKSYIKQYTQIGIFISLIFSFILALYFDSVIKIWFIFGSICVPSLIFLILGAYNKKLRLTSKQSFIGSLVGIISTFSWHLINQYFIFNNFLDYLEPMLVGLFVLLLFLLYGILTKSNQ